MKRLLVRVCVAFLLAGTMSGAAAAAPAAQPKVGDIPPDVLGRDRAGTEQSVSRHRGKVVIVTFWASWCGPCRHELPILDRLQRAVGRDHLQVIAINYKEPKRDFLNVIRANRGIDLTFVHDARGSTSDLYGVQSLPNMFIIDQAGKVAHVHRGYSAEMVEGFMREMLALLPKEVLDKPAGS